MTIRNPCNRCLVSAMCKQRCDLFSKWEKAGYLFMVILGVIFLGSSIFLIIQMVSISSALFAFIVFIVLWGTCSVILWFSDFYDGELLGGMLTISFFSPMFCFSVLIAVISENYRKPIFQRKKSMNDL